LGDGFGRKSVLWGSILGVLPFTLLLPHANLFWSSILTVMIGLILASAFSAIVVFAQELIPDRVGLISGVFFGFAFGMAGLGAAVLGRLADVVGIESVYGLCAFLPAIGLLAAFLPDVNAMSARRSAASQEASQEWCRPWRLARRRPRCGNELRRRNPSASYSGLPPGHRYKQFSTAYDKRAFSGVRHPAFRRARAHRASSQFDGSARTVSCIYWTYGLILRGVY